MKKKHFKIIAQNKKANYDYFINEKYEAGISLYGTEVKSIRLGKINLKDSYVSFKTGEALIIGMHISPYEKGNIWVVDPRRIRKLLLNKKEINSIIGKTTKTGFSVIPLKIYFSGAYIKLEIGLCIGKKKYDKRHVIAEREAKIRINRALSFKE
ncbi:MAG: SsrA-binding protein SmpB [Clostridiales bacterium]|nr:SsrA-binding protein SmpB [Clostridiales bacterium]